MSYDKEGKKFKILNISDVEKLKDEIKKELKSLKQDVEKDVQDVEKELKSKLTRSELKYFNNELKRPATACWIVKVNNLNIQEIKWLVKTIKNVLNEIGFQFVMFKFKRKLKKLEVIIDF